MTAEINTELNHVVLTPGQDVGVGFQFRRYGNICFKRGEFPIQVIADGNELPIEANVVIYDRTIYTIAKERPSSLTLENCGTRALSITEKGIQEICITDNGFSVREIYPGERRPVFFEGGITMELDSGVKLRGKRG
ncbi:hypothetical protein KKD37_04615 [Patescibacteria group bacterium]|nr:hypothetical protein [Patescibacteria group bacterium]